MSNSLHVFILIQSFSLPRHGLSLTLSRSSTKADNVPIARKVSRDVQHSFKASLMGHPGNQGNQQHLWSSFQLLNFASQILCVLPVQQSRIALLTPASAVGFARISEERGRASFREEFEQKWRRRPGRILLSGTSRRN